MSVVRRKLCITQSRYSKLQVIASITCHPHASMVIQCCIKRQPIVSVTKISEQGLFVAGAALGLEHRVALLLFCCEGGFASFYFIVLRISRYQVEYKL